MTVTCSSEGVHARGWLGMRIRNKTVGGSVLRLLGTSCVDDVCVGAAQLKKLTLQLQLKRNVTRVTNVGIRAKESSSNSSCA